MKKIILLLLTIGLFSCIKEVLPEPEPEPPDLTQPFMFMSRESTAGKVRVKIMVTRSFYGSIYVVNPTVYSPLRYYKPSIVDTTMYYPTIDMYSKAAINYGWGQLIK